MFAGRSNDSMRWAERHWTSHSESVAPMVCTCGQRASEVGVLGQDTSAGLRGGRGIRGIAIDIDLVLLPPGMGGLEDGPSVGLPMNRATVDLCARRGIEGQGMWTRAEGLWLRFDAGLWDELLDVTRELQRWGNDHRDTQIATVAELTNGPGPRASGRRRERRLHHRRDRAAGPADRGPPGAGARTRRPRWSPAPPPVTSRRLARSPQSSTRRRAVGRTSTASSTFRRSSAC